MGALRAGLVLMGVAMVWPAAAQLPADVAQVAQDIQTLAVINLINPTPEQMQQMIQVLQQYRQIADADPPAEVVQGLAKVKQLLVEGMDEWSAWRESGARQAWDEYNRSMRSARTETTQAIAKLLTDQQRQTLAMRFTPYEFFQRLIWEIGQSRKMNDEEWEPWAQRMAGRLSQSGRGQPLMSVDQAKQYLEQVRGMNDEQWQQAAEELYRQLVSRLPQRMQQALENPRRVEQRISRALGPLLDNPRAPQLLQECIKADTQKKEQGEQ